MVKSLSARLRLGIAASALVWVHCTEDPTFRAPSSSGGRGGSNTGGTTGEIPQGGHVDPGTSGSGTSGTSPGGTNQGIAGSSASGGASGSNGGTGSAENSQKELCETLASMQCLKFVECDRLFYKQNFSTSEECYARYTQACLQALQLPGNGMDSTRLTACASETYGQNCSMVARREGIEHCMAKGSLGLGAVCAHDWQCSTGLCSFRDKACGRCFSPAQVYDACAEFKDCAPGLGCIDGVCLSLPQEGKACNNVYLPCEPDLSCVNSGCKKSPQLGQPCDSYNFSAGAVCATSAVAYCDPASQTCLAYQLLGPGDSCADGTGLCQGQRCAQGVCVPYQKDGAPCVSSSECQEPARCREGSCTVIPSSCK